MARAVLRTILFGLSATGLLTGCVDGSGASGDRSASMTSTPARGGGAAEVEAPEVFQTTDSALWDGRPSLGGIWVASPNVKDPERVVIFNAASGKTVTGALFRRERDNPGPMLQVSSDAAEALGMLAGQPAQLRVTALRKVEVKAAPEDTAPEALAAVATTASPDGSAQEAPPQEAGAAKTAAVAAAALDAADAGTVSGQNPADSIADEPAKPMTWKERRAEAKAKREAEKAAKAAAAAGGVVATDGTDGIGVAAVETAPLDARAAEAAAGGDPAAVAPPAPEKKTRRQIRAEQEAAAAAASAAAAEATAATPAPAPVTSGRPIQIASFTKEENAARAVEALAKVGITAQPVRSERGGKVVWGVVAVGDAAMLNAIKGAGFADAYFLQ